MSEQAFSGITIRALMRLYQIDLKPHPDGSSSERLPWSVCPGARLLLDARGGTWSTNGPKPLEGGDRLDFIMRMECVTRERASEMLYEIYPAALKREQIPEEG